MLNKIYPEISFNYDCFSLIIIYGVFFFSACLYFWNERAQHNLAQYVIVVLLFLEIDNNLFRKLWKIITKYDLSYMFLPKCFDLTLRSPIAFIQFWEIEHLVIIIVFYQTFCSVKNTVQGIPFLISPHVIVCCEFFVF